VPICEILCLEFLIDHGTDEVVEAEIVLLTAFFVEWRLRIWLTFELGLKTKAVLIEKGALLVGSCVGELIGVDEGRGTFRCLTKMLQMSQFIAARRVVSVVALAFLQVGLRRTLFGERAVCVMQMFLACNKLMFAVQGAFGKFDARRIKNLCHFAKYFEFDCRFQRGSALL